MLTKHLQRLLATPIPQRFSAQVVVWFALSLTFAAIYSLFGLQEAFSHEYIVQDDARQHVFWMQRFIDSELFPDDLIADYFQSVAPVGYKTVYRIAATFGINPFVFNKFLPPLLGAIATGYCFGICMQLLPVPATAFMASLLLNQSLWMKDDLISATPRAFLYPLFLAFLYYLLHQAILPCIVAIALLALFYPQYILIAAGLLILRLLNRQDRHPRHSQRWHDYRFYLLNLGVALLAIAFYGLTPSEFAPVITATQAKTLPEFGETGRSYFFHDNPWYFFFLGSRSGLLNVGFVRPGTLALGVLLPILIRFPAQFPLIRQIYPAIRLLPQLLLVSVGLFLAAHALLFKLHLPSRYTEHSIRILLALTAAMVLTIILDAILKRGSGEWGVGNRETGNNERANSSCTPLHRRQFLALSSTGLIVTTLILYPVFVEDFPLTKYKVGHFPSLYQFFEEQPKDSLIASTAEEANNLPTFSRRSILVGREYAIPYHWGYYRQFRQRAIELIQAQYSPDLAQVKQFIQHYGIDFWLLEQDVFTPEYLANHDWLQDYQFVTEEARAKLEQAFTPALAGVVVECSVFQVEGFLVLEAACILNTTSPRNR
ncbi:MULTISPECIES: hypothetical protein [unclassified Coleofasciculus]|uniref:hypothetical protein n=1 Tax=unclassified Coleofasciculus TaxID=2692782 RepID=UPI00187F4F36|nr:MULTISPECIES: hypothetical protein [unclassified Coleofasciculus]MBE9126842.1 hypothetical protein [Coleofasciculus sp. LEGE 07081]MBE9148948.1 hypothetical protein [Coleofasciculus sp. LEGE 07092]